MTRRTHIRLMVVGAILVALFIGFYLTMESAHADTPLTRGEGRTEGSRSVDRTLQRTPTIALPDCTRDQKHGTNGIVREGDRAVWTVTLESDCVVGLSAFDRQGPRGQLVEVAVASGRGTHTLSVQACAQVDAHAGSTFERDAGDKFTSETYEETECQPTSTTTTGPPVPTTSPPSASVTTSSTTTPSSVSTSSTASAAASPVSCVPDCENPDAPEHVPQLAVGGAPEGTVPMALFGLAAILLGAAPLVWHGGKA